MPNRLFNTYVCDHFHFLLFFFFVLSLSLKPFRMMHFWAGNSIRAILISKRKKLIGLTKQTNIDRKLDENWIDKLNSKCEKCVLVCMTSDCKRQFWYMLFFRFMNACQLHTDFNYLFSLLFPFAERSRGMKYQSSNVWFCFHFVRSAIFMFIFPFVFMSIFILPFRYVTLRYVRCMCYCIQTASIEKL